MNALLLYLYYCCELKRVQFTLKDRNNNNRERVLPIPSQKLLEVLYTHNFPNPPPLAIFSDPLSRSWALVVLFGQEFDPILPTRGFTRAVHEDR